MTSSLIALLDADAHNHPEGLTRPVLRQHFHNGIALPFVSRAEDVYDLLAEFASLGECPELSGFTVTTTGWCAPLTNGKAIGAPSAHPERRRVTLCVAVNREGVCSRILFADDPANPVDDPGTATGSLAGAVLRAGVTVLGDALAEPLARLLVAELTADMGGDEDDDNGEED